MRRTLSIAAAVAALAPVWVAGPAGGATLVERSLAASSELGSRAREYTVAVPEDVDPDEPLPVVMVLHGCLQDQGDMIDDTRFVELVDRERFIAVFPFVTSWDPLEQRNSKCWGFWFDQHQHEGRGEPGDLRRILAEVEGEFPVDAERRYVAGLSSGAAMAVVMAVAYSEDFAAAGAVAGLPYDETACAVSGACLFGGLQLKGVAELVAALAAEQTRPEEQRLVPMMVVHSSNDRTVPFKNGQNIRDVWLTRHAASTTPEERDCTTEGVACEHSIYRDGAGRSVVETVFYDGPPFVKSHAWIGDDAGQFADPTGPSATELLWAFFAANPRSVGPAVQIGFDPVAVSGQERHGLRHHQRRCGGRARAGRARRQRAAGRAAGERHRRLVGDLRGSAGRSPLPAGRARPAGRRQRPLGERAGVHGGRPCDQRRARPSASTSWPGGSPPRRRPARRASGSAMPTSTACSSSSASPPSRSTPRTPPAPGSSTRSTSRARDRRAGRRRIVARARHGLREADPACAGRWPPSSRPAVRRHRPRLIGAEAGHRPRKAVFAFAGRQLKWQGEPRTAFAA